jgi:dTMP kinase
MLIEIEGIDGVGKTTQCRLLKTWFEDCHERAIIVKDLESTELGRKIKTTLVIDTNKTKEVELFAFLCCKANLFAETVWRELESGAHVICDRGTGSFLSYFEVLGFKRKFLKHLLSIALPGPYNPVVLLLDADVKEALQRNVAKPSYSKFDNMGTSFFEGQRRIYQELAQNAEWQTIDASPSAADVHRAIINTIGSLLPAHS